MHFCNVYLVFIVIGFALVFACLLEPISKEESEKLFHEKMKKKYPKYLK